MKTIEIAPATREPTAPLPRCPGARGFSSLLLPGAAGEPLRQSEAGAEDDPGSTQHLLPAVDVEA